MSGPALKICFIGHSNVGKSSILVRFAEGKFETSEGATVGVDFKVKFFTVQGNRYKLALWDTAGQERFRTLTASYYRDAQGVILVYDVTRRETFTQLMTEFDELEKLLDRDDESVVKLVVGNKIDLENDRKVGRLEGEALASNRGALFMETSAKTSDHIDSAMEVLLNAIIQQAPSRAAAASTVVGAPSVPSVARLARRASRFRANASIDAPAPPTTEESSTLNSSSRSINLRDGWNGTGFDPEDDGRSSHKSIKLHRKKNPTIPTGSQPCAC